MFLSETTIDGIRSCGVAGLHRLLLLVEPVESVQRLLDNLFLRRAIWLGRTRLQTLEQFWSNLDCHTVLLSQNLPFTDGQGQKQVSAGGHEGLAFR